MTDEKPEDLLDEPFDEDFADDDIEPTGDEDADGGYEEPDAQDVATERSGPLAQIIYEETDHGAPVSDGSEEDEDK